MTKAEQTIGTPGSDDAPTEGSASPGRDVPAGGAEPGATGSGNGSGSGQAAPLGEQRAGERRTGQEAGSRSNRNGAAPETAEGPPNAGSAADGSAAADEDTGGAEPAGSESRAAEAAAAPSASGHSGSGKPTESGARTATGDPAEDGGIASTESGGPSPAGRGRRRIGVLIAVASLAYVLDLVSKLIVVEHLEHRRPIEIVGEWLQLEAVRNPGAAFGIGEAFTAVFGLIAITVIAVIARIARKLYSLPWAVALGMLLGGALGNLTDRLFRSPGVFRGEVVDFIAPKYFAVFNLADSAIVCGGILIVLLSFRGSSPEGTVQKD